MSIENPELEFIAQMFHSQESKEEGYSMSCRWLCLREDLKHKYIGVAKASVEEWVEGEMSAKAARGQ